MSVFARPGGLSVPFISPERRGTILVLLGFIFAALLIGVVTATGNIMFTGLIVGVVTGVLLLNAVNSVVWIVLVGTLLIAGPFLLFFPLYGRLNWLFSILGFFLSLAAIAHAGTSRKVNQEGAPAYVYLLIAFSVYAIASTTFSVGSLNEGVGAIKRNLQFMGVAMALAFVPIAAKTVRSWVMFFMLLGVMQVPLALYQRIVLVPLRFNLPDRVVPVDIVAGTFEAQLTGGGNNIVMAYFVLLVIAGVICAYRESLLTGVKALALGAIVAIPLTLGETKIVLILLPVAFLAVFMDQIRKRPVVFVVGSMLASGALAALFVVYLTFGNHDDRPMTFEQRLQENIEYNFGNAGYFEGPSLNRSSVVSFWWEKNGVKDPIKTAFGHGLGASFSVPGTDSLGHLNVKYPRYSIDLTGVAAILWDLGIFGFLLYAMAIGGAWFSSRSLVARALPGFDRALCRTLSASIAMLAVLVCASNVMLWAPSMQVLMMSTLGLLAWRWRRGDRVDV